MYTTLATGTPWEYPYDPGAIPTIAKNSTVAHHQQAHEIYGKARRFLENATTIDEALKHKIFETIEDTYITELCKKKHRVHGIQDNRYGSPSNGHKWGNVQKLTSRRTRRDPMSHWILQFLLKNILNEFMTESSMQMMAMIHTHQLIS